MFDWIPFAAGGLVLLWALASFALAASGGPSSGLHEVADTRRRSEASVQRRRELTFRVYTIMNYLLALAVIAATIALFGATFFLS